MRLALGLLLALAALAVAPSASSADVVWLCKPGAEPNPCRESMATTVYAQDGSSRVENPGFPQNPAVDCFYVYPTVSGQPGTNADKSKDAEQIQIARYQAARYSGTCRVYAPVYRQLTLGSIFTGTPEARAAGRKIAYGDVREAWLDYLANENRGRGVVLVGHSQGAGMLRQLIRQEVDPKPDVRRRLISALLLGGNVLVRKGQTAGGDFQNIPACTSPTQLGCAIAFSIFGDEPPGNTRFGKSPPSDITGAGLPAGPDYEVMCTNPASLGANARTPVTSLLRSEPFPGAIGAGLVVMYGGPPPSAPTPWLQPAERYSVRCEQSNGANVLMAQPIGTARHLNPSPTPDWGLHLADANLPLSELAGLVAGQAAAYAKATAAPRLRIRVLCGKRGMRFLVGGKDRKLVKRAKVRRDGKRVRVAVTLRDGRSVTLTRRLPRC
jgi:hypothetical protein